MLGNYEKRYFSSGEKIWLGHYRNLTNVLHWHFECELIYIAEGGAQVNIGGENFCAFKGDCFFCGSEEPHCIIGKPDSKIDIIIFDTSLVKDLCNRYSLVTAKFKKEHPARSFFDNIEKMLNEKGPFYREATEVAVRAFMIDVLRNSELKKPDESIEFYKDLISKINNDFSFITFMDAVKYSGYSPSHFSKMFKKASGMNFSDYLNVIKVENAIELLRNCPDITMTQLSLQCGFSSLRNFNRVFKLVTGFSPRTLPDDYVIDNLLKVSKNIVFDPTDKESVLI